MTTVQPRRVTCRLDLDQLLLRSVKVNFKGGGREEIFYTLTDSYIRYVSLSTTLTLHPTAIGERGGYRGNGRKGLVATDSPSLLLSPGSPNSTPTLVYTLTLVDTRMDTLNPHGLETFVDGDI